MRSFPTKLSACTIAAAALLSACGGGGTTPGANNNSAVSGSTGACTAAPCINFSETTLGMVDFGTLGIAVANDPADATNKVAKLTKTTGSETWAGVTVHLGGADNSVARIDPALGITLRVYSPAVGKTIMVKIEDAAANGVEASATSTKAGEWETLTFTYASANAATTYNKVSVFPGFNTKLNEVYYIDELKYTQKATTPTPPPTSALTLLNFDETPAASLVAFEGTSFVAAMDGTNKVAKLTKPTTAQPWGGATFTSCAAGTIGSIPAIPFTSSLQTISIRVKAPRAGVTFSLEAKDDLNPGNLVFAQASNTGTDWETLTFNFANKTFGTAINPSQTYNKLSIFPNFNKANEGSAAAETTNRDYFFDDVKLVGSTATLGTCPQVPVVASPTTAPATPTENAANVISIYSDAFASTAGVNLNPGWGQSTVQTGESIASNNVLKLANFNYQGIDFDSNRINVSTKTSLHVDMWSANASTVAVSLIGPTNEQAYVVNLTANAWTSVNIPLSSYNLVDKTGVRQLKLESTPSASTVFVDNIYFK
jgi:hypothetical protein